MTCIRHLAAASCTSILGFTGILGLWTNRARGKHVILTTAMSTALIVSSTILGWAYARIAVQPTVFVHMFLSRAKYKYKYKIYYRCKLVWQMWSRRGPVAEHVGA